MMIRSVAPRSDPRTCILCIAVQRSSCHHRKLVCLFATSTTVFGTKSDTTRLFLGSQALPACHKRWHLGYLDISCEHCTRQDAASPSSSVLNKLSMTSWQVARDNGTLCSVSRLRAVQPASGPDQMSCLWHAVRPLMQRQLGQLSTASERWATTRKNTWAGRIRSLLAHNSGVICPVVCTVFTPATPTAAIPGRQLCTAAHRSLRAAETAPAQGASEVCRLSRTQTVCTSAVRATGNVLSHNCLHLPGGLQPTRRAGCVTTHAQPSAQTAQVRNLSSTPEYHQEGVMKRNWAMGEEERAHWESIVANFKRDTAVRAVKQLDPKWRYGISYERLGGLLIEGSRRKAGNAPSGSLWFRRAKTKDPLAVVIVRIGAFYETVGYDAAVLMEYGGYRPMGGRTSDIPRAGCPESHLQQVLKQLVEDVGLTVAVWEEAPTPKQHGTRNKEQKMRLFVQLVTPDNPAYLHGYSANNLDRDVDMPNIKGVSLSSTGFNVYVLNRNSDVISVYKNLSQESVWSILTADGSQTPVVYMHWPLDQPDPRPGSTASLLEKIYFSLQNQLKANNARIRKYKSAEPLYGFKHRVMEALNLPQDVDLTHLPAWDANSYWPGVRPLYYSSLCQLGLGFSPGIPSLAAYLLPEDSGTLVRQEITELLKNPPPHSVAAAIRRTLKMFESPDLRYWPAFDVSGRVTPKKLAGVLHAQEGNEKLFWALHGALQPMIIALSSQSDSPALSALVDSIWPLLSHRMGCQQHELNRTKMLQAATQAVADIKKVVVPTEEITKDDLPQKPAAGGGLAAVEPSLRYWSRRLEKFKKRVNSNVLQREYQQVETTFSLLTNLLDSLVYSTTLVAQQAQLQMSSKEFPYVHTDELNQAALIRLPSAGVRQHMKSRAFELYTCQDMGADIPNRQYQPTGMQQLLQQPYDRNGGAYKHKDVYTCNHLDMILSQYRDAVAEANEAATAAMQQLSCKLASNKTELVASLQLGILLQAVQEHFQAAKTAGWSLPLVGREEQLQAGVQLRDDCEHGVFSLKGFYPYWLKSGGVSAPVLNDLHLDGFMLLTGPNMAGKSTVLRSAAAAALCGCVGLFIPAAGGSLLPELDAILFRTFTGDAPIDRLSSFGMEMKEMACVLTDARAASLVLVDELGKGTEIAAGTSITAAMLHEVADSGAIGIFATHLHGLLEMQQDIPRIVNYSMEVVEQPTAAGHTRLVPTWRLLPGSCTKSLAFDVARAIGMPDDVLGMAQQDLRRLQQLGGFKALINIAAGNGQWGKHQRQGTSDSVTEGADTQLRASSSCIAGLQHDNLSDESQDSIDSSSAVSAAQQAINHSSKVQLRHQSVVTDLLVDLCARAQQLQTSAAGIGNCINSSNTSAASPTDTCRVHSIWWQESNPVAASNREAPLTKAHPGTAALYAVYSEQTGYWQSGYTENMQDFWEAYCSNAGGDCVHMWYVVLNRGSTYSGDVLHQQLHQAMAAEGLPLSTKQPDVVTPTPRRRRRKAAS